MKRSDISEIKGVVLVWNQQKRTAVSTLLSLVGSHAVLLLQYKLKENNVKRLDIRDVFNG